MSDVSGSVDHRLTQVSTTGNNEQFVNLYRFLNGPLLSGGYVEIVASNYGSSGTGFDYHDELTPVGENAWACFRWVTGSVGGSTSNRGKNMYMLVQFADGANFGTSPGSPATLDGGTGDGVGISVAWLADGGDPWNGGSGSLGSDAKGSPVWHPKSSTLYSLPRSNAIGGTHASLRQNTLNVNDQTASPTRYHILADRDNLAIVVDANDNGTFTGFWYCGCYTLIPGLSGTIDMPIFMLRDTAPPWLTLTTIGSTTGNSSEDGGAFGPNFSAGATMRGFRFDRFDANLFTTLAQPNAQFTSSVYDEVPLPVIMYETDYGLVGFSNFFNETFNAASNNVSPDATKVNFSMQAGGLGVSLPWITGSLPGDTSTREGRFI